MNPATVPSFVLERAAVTADAAGWQGVLHRPDGRTASVRFLTGEDASPPPDSLDGLAIAFLPTVMRAGGRLHVRGPVTRGALRNLTEYAESWANWRPNTFHPVAITADTVLDMPRRQSSGDALFAWSGGLRSTHTLVRHLDRLVPGAMDVRAVLRVTGMHRDDRGVAAADAGDDAARAHAVSGQCTAGLHARSWHLGAQLRFPRPGPALADLLSGDAFAVRADGGSAAAPVMAEEVGRHPALAAVLSDCRRRPHHALPCGTCPECTLMTLAFAARGRPLPRSSLRLTVPGVVGLPFGDPAVAADALATLDAWAGDRGGWQALLRTRAGLNRMAIDVRDHLRWAGAITGLLPPWPR